MDGLVTLLIFVVFVYLMMRFGCGAHLIHGKQCNHSPKHLKNEKEQRIDPVCGKSVDATQGYAKLHGDDTHWFCSRACLDEFEAHPSQYASMTPEV